jgi:hypothetical protein
MAMLQVFVAALTLPSCIPGRLVPDAYFTRQAHSGSLPGARSTPALGTPRGT